MAHPGKKRDRRQKPPASRPPPRSARAIPRRGARGSRSSSTSGRKPRAAVETREDDDRPTVSKTNQLGRGAFSYVYRDTWGTRPIAVKRLLFRDDYAEEAEILSELDHNNIMKYLGNRRNSVGTFDFALELASGGTLAKALYRGDLTLQWKRSTIYQLSDGLAYLHGRGILHLDLKPPNILFRDRDLEHLLIADFGMAKIASSAPRAGAMKFRAPDEVFTQKSDVYSLASIACCILVGRNPSSREEARRLVDGALRMSHLCSDWRKALIQGVQPEHYKRQSAKEFRDSGWNPSSLEETGGLVGRLNTDLYPNWRNAPNRGVQLRYYTRPGAREFRDAFALPPYFLEIEPELDIGDALTTRTNSPCRCSAVVAIAVAVFVILAAFLIWLFYPEGARE